MRDQIIKDYEIVLNGAWMQTNAEGMIEFIHGDTTMPVSIDGRFVIMPTREQLKNTAWGNRIGFHPLREAYDKPVSDILSALRDQYVSRLNATIAYFISAAIKLAHAQPDHKNLSPEQGQILNPLSSVTKASVGMIEALLKSTAARNDAMQFINIHIRRGGQIGNTTYGRAGLVQFPIYNELKTSKDGTVNGVKISNKDRDMLISLFEYMLPSLVDSPEAFSVGIDARVAPFMEALMRCVIAVMDELEKVFNPMVDVFKGGSLLTFPPDRHRWIEIFDNKDLAYDLAMSIPSMNESGSRGPDEIEKPKAKEEPAKVAPVSRSREVAKVVTAPTSDAAPTAAYVRPPPGRLGAPARAHPTPDREDERRRREREDEDRKRRDRENEDERRRREDRQRDDRDRREREREEERRRREREDDDRDRGRDRDDRSRSDRDRDYGRDRPRDGYRDDRDRDDSRGRNTGDVFDDCPALRANLDDDRSDRYGRGRDRDDRGDRDRGGRGGRDYGRRNDRDYDRPRGGRDYDDRGSRNGRRRY